jgi:hypothetical protein
MSAYFSYIDTALRVIYINRSSSLTVEEQQQLKIVLEEAETSRHIRKHLLRKFIQDQIKNNASIHHLLIHEIHHYFQGLCYPFLYYLNWLEFDNLMHIRNLIKTDKTESFQLDQVMLLGKFRNNATFTTQQFELFWDKKRLWVRSPEENSRSQAVFSLYDLLEDVTTIFQYKITENSPTADGFYAYVQNPSNKCYKRLYRFLVKEMGKQYAYDLLPVLVQVAFSTTEPISAFCNAVSLINYQLDYYDMLPIEEVYDFLMERLTKSWGTYTIDPVKDMFFQDLPVRVLRREDIGPLVEFSYEQADFMHYPLSLHAMKMTRLSAKQPEVLLSLLTIDPDKFRYLVSQFYPFAIHYHFFENNGRNGAFFVGGDFEDKKTPLGIEYGYYIKELIKIKEVTQGLLTKVHEHVPSTCHHTDCSYYPLGLCRKWNSVPNKAEDCGFPDWFSFIFYRQIRLSDRTLVKINKEEADLHWERYISRSHKDRKFDFIKTKSGFLLTVGKDDFEGRDRQNVIVDFISYLNREEGIEKANLFGKIAFDFYEFDEDPRPIFDIPELRSWLQKTWVLLPDLLCYIDFNNEVDHLFVVLPALIKHKKKVMPGGNYEIHYDERDWQKFMLNQAAVFRKFHQENPKLDPEILFRTLDTFLYGNQNNRKP